MPCAYYETLVIMQSMKPTTNCVIVFYNSIIRNSYSIQIWFGKSVHEATNNLKQDTGNWITVQIWSFNRYLWRAKFISIYIKWEMKILPALLLWELQGRFKHFLKYRLEQYQMFIKSNLFSQTNKLWVCKSCVKNANGNLSK